MEPLKKNRMKIESVEPENDPSVTQYETEDYTAFRDKQIRQNSSFVPWALFIFIFLLVAGFGVWYQFLRKSEVFTENLPKQDVFIEDGAHDIDNQISALMKYHSLVKPGGYYICEDLFIANLTKYLIDGVYQITDRNFTTTILDYHNRPNGLADDVMVIIQFLN